MPPFVRRSLFTLFASANGRGPPRSRSLSGRRDRRLFPAAASFFFGSSLLLCRFLFLSSFGMGVRRTTRLRRLHDDSASRYHHYRNHEKFGQNRSETPGPSPHHQFALISAHIPTLSCARARCALHSPPESQQVRQRSLLRSCCWNFSTRQGIYK